MCKIMEQERAEGKAEAYIDLVKDGLLTVEVAAERLNMSEEQFEEIMKEYAH